MTLAPEVIRAGVVVLVVALTAAFLFGTWHAVVGGLVNGNPRAGTFGLALASVTAALLAGIAAIVRRPSRDG
ncbi:MAG TPA: hypothetical protein VFJ71_02600 [Candidatus Limnocylindrales bacterium]|nr:hypothetical protein [Candidatus Limnocylindrales bacterium]